MTKLSVFLTLVLLLLPTVTHTSHTKHLFPKRANYFLHWSFDEAAARELAKWDLLILDMETQVTSRPLLAKIRQWNPDIIMLAYITSEEIRRDAALGASQLRQQLYQQIDPRWFAVNTKGERQSFWPGTDLLNMSVEAPTVGGKKMNKALADFVATKLLSTGLWDGVFYDNAFDGITWFTGPEIDLNFDGRRDANPDLAWREGMKFLYDETRRLTDNKFMIAGNGTTRAFRDQLNGNMLENFLPSAWTATMRTYSFNHDGGPQPRINLINANTANRGGPDNYQAMRFGLTSALLADGYYSFDFGDQNHGQLWRYDEYEVDLGRNNGAAGALTDGRDFAPAVWQRSFDHGVAVVNSTDRRQAVPLNGEFEKLRGGQAPVVNDGSIVSELTLEGYDGLILLKTLETLSDTLFTNGALARFLRPDGARVRNGFFVFEEQYAGGDQIAHIDLDGNGQRDLVAVAGNQLLAWRDDGQPYMSLYPYTVNYKGELRIAIGDLDGDGKLEIVVAPGTGKPGPLKVYTRHGESVGREWYPFGTSYVGGVSVAIGDVDGGGRGELIVGVGRGLIPKVRIYKNDEAFNFRISKEFPAFETSFRGGVNVAVGNLDGVGFDEIIVGAGSGKPPLIRTFDGLGTRRLSEFTAYRTAGKPGIEVRAVDVDFDGKDDIVGLSTGVGL